MTTQINGKVSDRNPEGMKVVFSNNCFSCQTHSCYKQSQASSAKQIFLPHSLTSNINANSKQIVASMTLRSQLLLILNSLLLPLIGIVGGASAATFVGLGEGITILWAIVGLALGALVCRRFPDRYINIKEVD